MGTPCMFLLRRQWSSRISSSSCSSRCVGTPSAGLPGHDRLLQLAAALQAGGAAAAAWPSRAMRTRLNAESHDHKGLPDKLAHQVVHASHLSAPQGHHRQQAAAAALQDGAHSVEHPLLPAFPGQVIGHPICGLHHHCSITQRSSQACMWTHGQPLARLLKHGRRLHLHTPPLQATEVVVVRICYRQTT